MMRSRRRPRVWLAAGCGATGHLLSLAFAWGLDGMLARAWSAPSARWMLSATARRLASAITEPASPRPLAS
jgi:hypothetical protein